MDNFREAMHGDAARTAALLLMIACSTAESYYLRSVKHYQWLAMYL